MSKNIKSVKVFKRELILKSAASQELEEVSRIVSEIHYNEKGEVIKDIKYNANEAIEQILRFKYDDNGNLIEEIMCDEDDSVIEKKSFEHDENNKISKEYLHFLDGSFDTVFYSYDEKGRIVEKKKVDSDDEVEEITTFKYDGDNLILQEIADAEGNVINSLSFKFNEKGLLVEEIEYNGFEETELKKEFEYNDKGSRIASFVYDANEQLIEKSTYKENEQGKVIEVTEENSIEKNVIELDYNEKGNVTLHREFDKNANKVSEVIKIYDNEDNLIETKVESDKPFPGGVYSYSLVYEYEFN